MTMDLNGLREGLAWTTVVIGSVGVGWTIWFGLRARRLRGIRRLRVLQYDEFAWRLGVEQAAAEDLGAIEDQALLLNVLGALHEELGTVARGGEAIFGGSALARAAADAWNGRVDKVMSGTIRTIDDNYSALLPYLVEAGLTGPELRFKALAFFAFRRAGRLTVAGVADGEPDLVQILERMLRSGALAKMFKAGDIVWESAAAAVATWARVHAGTPPAVKSDSELSKHAVTEFKKMVEGVLERFKPR